MRHHQIHNHKVLSAKNAKHRAEEVAMNKNYPDHPVHGTALFQTANLLEQFKLRPELGDIHGDGMTLNGVSPIFNSKY